MSIKTCSGSDSQLAKYEADLYQCRQQRGKNEAAGEVRRGEKLLLLRKMLYFVARQSGVSHLPYACISERSSLCGAIYGRYYSHRY